MRAKSVWIAVVLAFLGIGALLAPRPQKAPPRRLADRRSSPEDRRAAAREVRERLNASLSIETRFVPFWSAEVEVSARRDGERGLALRMVLYPPTLEMYLGSPPTGVWEPPTWGKRTSVLLLDVDGDAEPDRFRQPAEAAYGAAPSEDRPIAGTDLAILWDIGVGKLAEGEPAAARIAKWFREWAVDPPADGTLPERVVRSRGRAPMRLVRAGTFQMGRSVGEDLAEVKARGRGEAWHPKTEDQPRHAQTVPRALYVDETEVTVRQWRIWRGEDVTDLGDAGDLPITDMPWEEAHRYAVRAGGDLPTEVEWEYAARGGAATTFPWGDEDDPRRRNGSGAADGFAGVAPVGRFPPNGYGLFDMIGNVSEWCSDDRFRWYDRPAFEGPLPEPIGHLVRDGNWQMEPLYLRSSYRGTLQTGPLANVGFRVVVRTPPLGP